MNSVDDMWALVWRLEPGQPHGALRGERLVDALRGNSEAWLEGKGDVMVLAGVHETLEEALEYKRYLRQLRRERRQGEPVEGEP